MNKIMRLKKWMTPDAAAKSLTLSLDEEVTAADIYQLALEKEITISVVFPHRKLTRHSAIEAVDTTAYLVKTEAGELFFNHSAHSFDDDDSEDFSFIDGIWDLHIEGDGKIEIKREFYRLTSDIAVHPKSKFSSRYRRYMPGLVVLRHPEKKNYVQLYERCRSQDGGHAAHDYHSAEKLPDDCQYVVRTDELRRLENHIADGDSLNVNEPWVSADLALVNKAARRFWQNADRDDVTSQPSIDDVKDWLTDQGMGDTRAKKAASIIRPHWAGTGRPPKY